MFRSQSHKNVRCNPKVTLHRNGTCTVSGIPFDMARHIANMAYLRAAEAVEENVDREVAERADAERMEILSGIRPVVESNWLKDRSWCAAALTICSRLCDAFGTTVKGTYGSVPATAPTKAERWENLKRKRSWDARFDMILGERDEQ
jgi:hypothetical protein